MRDRKSIPILGIDERPNERQNIPGLAEVIEGVRPEGLEREPYWTAIPAVETLKNSSDVAFNHSNSANIVKVHWHVRGRAGKFGDAGGSLKRLVVLFNDGTIEVVDPGLSAGFETVVSYTVSSTDPGSWDMGFTQMYDTGYLTVTKGGVPQQDLLLEDDLIIENVFPELPVVKSIISASDKGYSQVELDGGEHEGFKTSYYFVRYAFRLKNGTLVKHTTPERIYTPVIPYDYQGDTGADTYFTSFLNFYLEGYDQISVPGNFAYWKDKIRGITVLITESLLRDGETASLETQRNNLQRTLWYELGTFDSIDVSELDLEQRNLRIDIKDEAIGTLPVADIDDNTHHNKSHAEVFNYNSRLIQGVERTNFSVPGLNYKEGIYNRCLYVMADPTSPLQRYFIFEDGDVAVFGLGATISSIVNCTVEQKVVGLGSSVFWVIDPSQANFSFRMTFNAGYNFYIDITQDTISDYTNRIIPISEFHLGSAPLSSNVILEATIETDNGEYVRRLENAITPWVYDDNGTKKWDPLGSVIFYPDVRAKVIRLYVEQNSSGQFDLIKTYHLRASDKANFAFSVEGVTEMPDDRVVTSEPDPVSVNLVKELERNKVRVSDVNSFLSFESDLVYTIGRSSEKVTGFAVNALEVSQGQFGQYPVYIFKNEGIWALEQSQSPDVVFSRVTPVDTILGVDSQAKITNVGQGIVFANNRGVYVLEGAKPVRISEPVQSIHSNIKALGYLRTDNDRELLVAAGLKVYRYSFKYKMWYTSNENVEYFFNDAENLYALYADKSLKDYQNESGNEVPVSVILDHIHFGLPDTKKRFFFFYLRGIVDDVLANKFALIALFGTKSFNSVKNSVGSKRLRVKWRSEESVNIVIGATFLPGIHQLHKIDTEYEVRYPRKLRG